MIPAVVQAAVDAALAPVDATITLRVPETHQSNQLFDVWAESGDQSRHFIAKQYLKEDEWETAPAREHASLQKLESLDVAPRPFFYDAAIGPVVIYAYMDGRMWGRYQPSAEELHALAVTMARLHLLPTTDVWLARGSDLSVAERVAWFHHLLENYAAWSAATYPPGQAVVKLCRPLVEQSSVILEQLHQSMPALRFCRSDPRFANVIVRPDESLGFVDWEDAGLRDPALEMADLLLHTEQEDLLTQVLYEPFLATYCGLMGSDLEQFSQRVREYCLVLPLFYIVILMRYGIGQSRAGKLAGWQVNEMPANLRLQRYLARALSRSLWDFDPGAYADIRFFPTD